VRSFLQGGIARVTELHGKTLAEGGPGADDPYGLGRGKFSKNRALDGLRPRGVFYLL